MALPGSNAGGVRDARIVDETLDQLGPSTVEERDMVGIGIHTGDALPGYEIGRFP